MLVGIISESEEDLLVGVRRNNSKGVLKIAYVLLLWYRTAVK